jgi:5-methylthioribose kinase
MRRLHGDHIFRLPLRPNEFPRPAALEARARALWDDAELVRVADAAYARYLEPSGALVHGDVQAGNVLLAASAPKLLDAEIAHVGDPAFDLGSLLAHLALPAVARGALAAARPALGAAFGAHRGAHGPGAPKLEDAVRYAGLELLRRTVGAARVPAATAPDAALALLATAEVWIKRPPGELASLQRA